MARSWRRRARAWVVAFTLPLVLMGPAWAGRYGVHRCPSACETFCQPIVTCPADPVAYPCHACVEVETVTLESQVSAAEPETVFAEPVPSRDQGPVPAAEPVSPLEPATVARASAEHPAPTPTETPATEPEGTTEPAMAPALEQSEPLPETVLDVEPSSDATDEVPPEPASETAPSPDMKPVVEPEPQSAPPVEKNIFEEADGEDPQPATKTEALDDDPPEPAEEPADPDSEDPFAGRQPPVVEPMRRWVDDTGIHDTVGQLVEIHPDRVRILKLNGAFSTVPLDRLSSADRNYVTSAGKRLTTTPHTTVTAGL